MIIIILQKSQNGGKRKMLTVFSIYQYVKGKLEKTEEGTSAYDALWDVYQFIRVNMNSSYGMMNDLSEAQVNQIVKEKLAEEKKNENIH